MITKKQITLLLQITKKAGDLAIKLQADGLIVTKKTDGSFVTNADTIVEDFLISEIKNTLKNNDKIISEELIARGEKVEILKDEPFWSIDPIDSTKSYINKNPYYCINIAYIKKNTPVFGLIYAPELQTMWYGDIKNGAFKQIANSEPTKITTRITPNDYTTLVSSDESETPKEIIEKLKVFKEIKIPSAIKLALIAEGSGDFYFRKRNKACDWDIASGHALILSAGGVVEELDKQEHFQYGVYPYLAPSMLFSGKKN
jgi:3'(2'), 5'-bisphosphate nucleotidase